MLFWLKFWILLWGEPGWRFVRLGGGTICIKFEAGYIEWEVYGLWEILWDSGKFGEAEWPGTGLGYNSDITKNQNWIRNLRKLKTLYFTRSWSWSWNRVESVFIHWRISVWRVWYTHITAYKWSCRWCHLLSQSSSSIAEPHLNSCFSKFSSLS